MCTIAATDLDLVSIRLPVAKRQQFSRVTAVPYRSGDVAILDAKISARIRYGNLAHVSDGCRQKHSELRPKSCR